MSQPIYLSSLVYQSSSLRRTVLLTTIVAVYACADLIFLQAVSERLIVVQNLFNISLVSQFALVVMWLVFGTLRTRVRVVVALFLLGLLTVMANATLVDREFYAVMTIMTVSGVVLFFMLLAARRFGYVMASARCKNLVQNRKCSSLRWKFILGVITSIATVALFLRVYQLTIGSDQVAWIALTTFGMTLAAVAMLAAWAALAPGGWWHRFLISTILAAVVGAVVAVAGGRDVMACLSMAHWCLMQTIFIALTLSAMRFCRSRLVHVASEAQPLDLRKGRSKKNSWHEIRHNLEQPNWDFLDDDPNSEGTFASVMLELNVC